MSIFLQRISTVYHVLPVIILLPLCHSDLFSQNVYFIPCYYCCRLFLPAKMTSTLHVSYQKHVKYVSISKYRQYLEILW